MLFGASWIPVEWRIVQDYDCLIRVTELLLDDSKKELSRENSIEAGMQKNLWTVTPIGKMRLMDSKNVEAGPLFELFYRKTAPLHAVSIEMTGFSKNLTGVVLLKKGKRFHKKVYSGSHFRHGISHKSCVSSFPYSSSNLAGALYAKV